MITIHQRYRQTDRQTTCDRSTALCTKVHRAVKRKSYSKSKQQNSEVKLTSSWLNGSVIKIIVNPMKHTTNNKHYICTVYTVWRHSNGWWFERNLGRPRTTWRRTVEKERPTLGWRSWGQARTVTHDRTRCRRCIDTLCVESTCMKTKCERRSMWHTQSHTELE